MLRSDTCLSEVLSSTETDSTKPSTDLSHPRHFSNPAAFSSARSLRAKKEHAYTKNQALCEATATGRITVEHAEYEKLLRLYWLLYQFDDKPSDAAAKELIAHFENVNAFYDGAGKPTEPKQSVDPYDSMDCDGLDPYGTGDRL